MVVMTPSTDLATRGSASGDDPGFFYPFSPGGPAAGTNVLLHAMTR